MNTVPAIWSCFHKRCSKSWLRKSFTIDIWVLSIARNFCDVLLNDSLCLLVKILKGFSLYIMILCAESSDAYFSWLGTHLKREKKKHNIRIELTRKVFLFLEFLLESSFSEFKWRSLDVWMPSILREGRSDQVHIKNFVIQIKTQN